MVPGEPDALAAAISAMAEVSKIQTDTMQELKKAVDTLLTAVDALPKAEKDDLNETEQKDIEEETMWEMVRDTAKEQEKETVESWKDELNNLLVFAGLFSAVVTAFTVESYTWLQQDPGDASNALLAQLSLQLTMFMITFAGSLPSSAFANSTTPALSLSDVQSSFSPVSYAVSVNTLWVLSLTLSLISAFFAIASQQWLRQLHLPPEMPVRRAVQLLEARKDGLKTWQVPSIIALLPLLLQIAVIFFLVGLFLLLRSLNATVASAFGSVAVVGLLAFLATVFIPLITARCPYKTPLVPTIVIVVQCLSYPIVMLSWPLVFFSHHALRPSTWREVEQFSGLDMSFRRYPIWWAVRKFYKNALLPYLKNFGRHMFVDMGQFWLTREYQYIYPRDEADHPNLDLERSSLLQTFLSTPARRSSKVSQLLNSSKGDTSARGVQDTVASSLRAFRTGLKWSDLIPQFVLDPKMAPYIGKWLSARHHRLLWQYLQQRDWKRDGKVTLDDSRYLLVFHELDDTFPATRPRYAKHLLQICAQQELSDSWAYSWETVTACLVLDLIMNRGYVPDEGDADALLAFASKVYGKYRGNLGDDDKRRLFLVSTALALIAVNKSGAAHSDGLTSVVNTLAGALDKESTKESAVSGLEFYYEEFGWWSRRYPEYMSPARIMQALCEALSDYAASPLLSPYSEHLLHLGRTSTALRIICSEEDYKARPEMEKARGYLDRFDVRVEEVGYGLIESTMEALVLAEARLHRAHTYQNGDSAPVCASSTAGLSGTSGVPPSSASAVTTGAISLAQGDSLESAYGAETHGAHAPLHDSALTDCSSLSPPDPIPATFVSDVVVSCARKEREGGEAQAPNISLPTPRMQEAQIESSSPTAVEEASASDQGPDVPSASDANGVGGPCTTSSPILPVQTYNSGSVDSAVREHEPALQSNITSTDNNLSRLPPVENSTDKRFVASGSKSAAPSALEPDEPQENPAVPLHLLTSKPQQGEMIQDVAASIPEPVVEESPHSSLRNPEGVSRASNIQSAAVDDNHSRKQNQDDEETHADSSGDVERDRVEAKLEIRRQRHGA